MAVTPTSFREAFPAFSSTALFPDAQINIWLTFAVPLHNADRYGNLLDLAVQLFVAHNLVLERQSAAASAMGQAPGVIVGAQTSGSVDKVSWSRDGSAAMDPKNGHWNLSSYGMRWVQLVQIVGAGAVQLGVPSPEDPSVGAWPGPILGPW